MKVIVGCLVLLPVIMAGEVAAYPVSYEFSGVVSGAQYMDHSWNLLDADVSKPLSIDGHATLSGSATMVGLITFDSDLTEYSSGKPHPGQAFYDLIQGVEFKIYAEGMAFEDTFSSRAWDYSGNGFSFFSEGPNDSNGTILSPFDRSSLNFRFAQPTQNGEADYLDVANFIDGSFSFSDGFGCISGSTLCNLKGEIRSLSRVATNVDANSPLILFWLAGAGYLLTRRKMLLSN